MYATEYNCPFCKKLLYINNGDDCISTFICKNCCDIENIYVELSVMDSHIIEITLVNNNYRILSHVNTAIWKKIMQSNGFYDHKQIFRKRNFNIFDHMNITPINMDEKIKLINVFS